MRWKHYFWDFDGTIMDTYPVTVRCCVELAAEYGLTVTPLRVRNLMLDTLKVCLDTLSDEIGIPEEEFFRGLWAKLAKVPPEEYAPVRGIPELIRELKNRGAAHYLVTNRDLSALDMLRAAGILDCFTDWSTSEDGFPPKPDPACVKALLEKHSLDPQECLMLGDRPLDVRAGYGAGMEGLLLDPYGLFPEERCLLRVSAPEEWADYLLHQPEEMVCGSD